MSQNIARRPKFGVTVAQIRLSSEGPVTCDEPMVEILQYLAGDLRWVERDDVLRTEACHMVAGCVRCIITNTS